LSLSHQTPDGTGSPLLSIIVPSFNQGAFIRRTIESCLEQDYRPIEIVVVDGASKDGTLDVLRSFDGKPEVRWVSEPDSGVVEAVNKGFRLAKGVFAAIQSSDDAYLPGAFRRAIPELASDESLGFVFGDIVKIDAEGREISRAVLEPFSPEAVLSVKTWIPQPSCFFRLDLARAVGGWREEVPYAADTDLWFRMMLKARGRKIDAFLAQRRVHGGQRDKQGARIIRDYTQTVKDLFDRSGAPPKLRPAAEAGVLLMMNRYGRDETEEVRSARWAQAVSLYPPLRGPRRSLAARAFAALRRLAGRVRP